MSLRRSVRRLTALRRLLRRRKYVEAHYLIMHDGKLWTPRERPDLWRKYLMGKL